MGLILALLVGALLYGIFLALYTVIEAVWLPLLLIAAFTLGLRWVINETSRRLQTRHLYCEAIIKRATEQHQAILDGNFTKGHYGDYPAAVPAHCIDDLNQPA